MGDKKTAIKNLKKVKDRSGRPKGSKDKFTNLKQAYLEAFEKMGGVDGLHAWATKSPDTFYTQVSKMLPREVAATVDNKGPAPSITVIVSADDESK